MNIKKIAKNQPKSFEFNKKNIELEKKIISNYPEEKQGLANLLILIRVMQCQEYFQEMGPKAGLE